MNLKIDGVLIKSENALRAESAGRFGLSEICRRLRVPAEIEPDLPWDGEWHHVSAYANRVRYYSLAETKEWLKSSEGQSALAKAKIARKAKLDLALERRIPCAKVSWEYRETVWKNGRPKSGGWATEWRRASEVVIHPKKIMWTIVFANGESTKKKAFSFRVYGEKGEEIALAFPGAETQR